MCDQEVQSHVLVAETSSVYRAVVVEVGVEDGVRCESQRVVHQLRHKDWRRSACCCQDNQI